MTKRKILQLTLTYITLSLSDIAMMVGPFLFYYSISFNTLIIIDDN